MSWTNIYSTKFMTEEERIMEISVNTRQLSRGFAAVRPGKADSGDFMIALDSQTVDKEENKLPPEQWVTAAGFSADAVKAAADFMRNELGIDVSKIEPTHEITPEQMEWLRSRHDFSSMRHYETYSFKNDGGQTQYGFKSTPEYSNFLADLMYLGVYTEQELTVGLWVEPIDTRPGGSDSVISTHLSDYIGGSPFDFSRAMVSNLENMWNFYNERSKGAFAVDGDAGFAALIKDNYLPLQKQFLELLDKLFNSGDEDISRNITEPPIEDISQKLKEDFGGIM